MYDFQQFNKHGVSAPVCAHNHQEILHRSAIGGQYDWFVVLYLHLCPSCRC